MRKPRPDSKLDFLPEDQDEQLMEWILGRVPYRTIVERMKEEYGVSTSIRAISEYWQKWGAEHWKNRRHNALQMAKDVVEDARSNPGMFDEAALHAIEQKVFALAMDPTSSAKELKGLVQLLVKHEQNELRERSLQVSENRLALAREKFRRETCELFVQWYDDKRASEIVDNTGLSIEQKTEHLGKLIFGEDW